MTGIKLEPKLTPENKNIITKDWAAKFPELTVYKPMWFLRRSGPLVSGIVLERTSSNDQYKPTFHVHCLAKANESLTLMLHQRLATRRSGIGESIKVRFHYDHVEDATTRMREQIKFPLSTKPSLRDVLDAYYRYLMSLSPAWHPVREYEDVVCYYVWCGMADKAMSVLDGFMTTRVLTWELSVMERDGGADAWYRQCRNWIENPDAVRQTVLDEVVKHKLTKIPDLGFDCSAL